MEFEPLQYKTSLSLMFWRNPVEMQIEQVLRSSANFAKTKSTSIRRFPGTYSSRSEGLESTFPIPCRRRNLNLISI
jgi:hypothetical protein